MGQNLLTLKTGMANVFSGKKLSHMKKIIVWEEVQVASNWSNEMRPNEKKRIKTKREREEKK